MAKTKEQLDRIEMMKQVAVQREQKKKQASADPTEAQPAPITVEAYQQLKSVGMTDVKIMKRFNMHSVNFYNWKNENGLLRKKRADVEKVERNSVSATNNTNLAAKAPDSAEKVQIPEPAAPKLIVKEKYDELVNELSNVRSSYSELNIKLQEAEELSASLVQKNDQLKADAEKNHLKIIDTGGDSTNQKKVEELQMRVRELEAAITVEINEKNKYAAEYYSLCDKHLEYQEENVMLWNENKRLNRLKTYLLEDNLKIIEQAGNVRLEQK